MKVVPSGQSAKEYLDATIPKRRWTVADPTSPPAGTTAPMYGPLWSYAKAAKYSAAPEPVGGYSTFATTDWSTLYAVGPAPQAVSYPTSPPYAATTGTYFQAPAAGHKGVRGRRVLNVALLSCPSSNVAAVGRFFMTVPATSTHLWAEFAGVAAESSLGTQVELYP